MNDGIDRALLTHSIAQLRDVKTALEVFTINAMKLELTDTMHRAASLQQQSFLSAF